MVGACSHQSLCPVLMQSCCPCGVFCAAVTLSTAFTAVVCSVSVCLSVCVPACLCVVCVCLCPCPCNPLAVAVQAVTLCCRCHPRSAALQAVAATLNPKYRSMVSKLQCSCTKLFFGHNIAVKFTLQQHSLNSELTIALRHPSRQSTRYSLEPNLLATVHIES